MYSRAVAYGNMLFLSGVGYHKPGTIEDHTKGVLDEIKQEPGRCRLLAAEMPEGQCLSQRPEGL